MNQITRLVPAEAQHYLPEMLDLGRSSGRGDPADSDRDRAS